MENEKNVISVGKMLFSIIISVIARSILAYIAVEILDAIYNVIVTNALNVTETNTTYLIMTIFETLISVLLLFWIWKSSIKSEFKKKTVLNEKKDKLLFGLLIVIVVIVLANALLNCLNIKSILDNTYEYLYNDRKQLLYLSFVINEIIYIIGYVFVFFKIKNQISEI